MKSKIPLLKTVLFSFLGITLLFMLLLPFLCNTYLLPRLIEDLPFSQKEFSLSRISPWKTIGTLRLSEDNTLVASIPKFELHYSPLTLMRGEIDTLLIDGSTLQLMQKDKRIVFSKSGEKTTSKKKSKSSITTRLGITVNKIVIRDSHLRIQTEKAEQDLTVDALLEIDSRRVNRKYELTDITAKIETAGDLNLTSSIRADFEPNEILLKADIHIPNITDLSQITAIDQTILPGGSLDSTTDISVQAETLALNTFNLNAHIDNVRGSFNGVATKQTLRDVPVQVSITGNQDTLKFNLTNLSIETSQVGFDCNSSGTIEASSKTFHIVTDLYSRQLQSTFTLKSSGRYENQSFNASVDLISDKLTINPNITTSPIQLNGNIFYGNDVLESRLTGNIDRIQMSARQLRAEAINWDLFFKYPQHNGFDNQQSILTIGAIHFKDEKVASLTAHFTQEEDALNYNTDIKSEMDIPGTVHCSGLAHYSRPTTANCSLPVTPIDSSLFPSFIPIPEKTSFAGNINASAAITINKGAPTGNLDLQLSDGSLSSGQTEVTGIETTIHIPALPSIQSAPGQLATIGSIHSGKILVEGGKIIYRIENEQQLFLEKVRLSWCGGKIETGSLTLSSKMDGLETTLYCDRLGFAPLLQQFGIEDTEGEGSLNGRLPVSFNKQGILFDDGFLFSTPGNSGIVRFTNTDQLQQGMPDIGQSATLDYSIKSLENFAYNWTKLTFNTEDDNLLLALQLDGKPAEPLPFGYKNGQIVGTDKGPGLQHPVRLDMNFRLPLQELFQYGKSLQSLMENM
ncbi:intermembrane phospholipid transport protein YdbH family protein [Desulforhopalus sp. 52FAK]